MNKQVHRMKWSRSAIVALALFGAVWFAAPARLAAPAAVEDVGTTFKVKCASCHGADGSGSSAVGKKMGLRDLRSAEVQKQSDAQLQTIIGKGKGKMTGYEKSLGADQVKALVGYVRQLGKK